MSRAFIAGESGAKLLARQWSVPKEKVRTWVSHQRLHGIDGLRPKRSTCSAQFKLQVLCQQDREQRSSRQVAAILGQGGVEAFGIKEQEHPGMKKERCCPAPPSTASTDSAQALREENEQLCAMVACLKKIASLDPVKEISCADKVRLIAGLRRHHKLANLLQVASLARSTFYCQCQSILLTEQQSDMEGRIRAVYEQHKGRYGYRRITAALCNSMAQPINHKCVQRLMQKMGLRALIRAKKRSR